ncbi:MAG: hypothetical protein IJJ68_05885 [Prevotella sp.]|nr:hypothetical protein [Prevotella sp.]
MKKKNVIKDLIVLWIALGALGCAAVNLHISLNMLGKKIAQTHKMSGTSPLAASANLTTGLSARS